MKQTRCPYTTNLLSETKVVNNEHILPVAIGAPVDFHVSADAAMNSQMNERIDAPFSNDQVIRFMAMSQGVESRSGPVTAALNGVVKSTNENVRAVFGKGYLDLKFVKPVEIDPATGLVKVVKGFGGEAAKQAEIIKKNYAKKGMVAQFGDPIANTDPWIHGSLKCDLNLVQQQLVKIAYLMSVRIWGDRAILSRSGEMYRQALSAKGKDSYAKIGFKGGTVNPLPSLFRRPQHHEHLLAAFVQGAELVSVVSLFGTFTAFFMSPADGLEAEDAEGEYITVDASAGRLQCRSFLDEMVAVTQQALPQLAERQEAN